MVHDIRDDYEGKWYGIPEANEVEKKLQKEARTGDQWHWQNGKGERVYLSS